MATARQLIIVTSLLLLLAFGCGGGSGSEDGATGLVDGPSEPTQPAETSPPKVEAEPTYDEAPVEDKSAELASGEERTTTPIGRVVATGEIGPRPDPLDLIPFAGPPGQSADPVAGATAEVHLAAMFAKVVERPIPPHG